MRYLCKFISLPWRDQWLHASVAFWMLAVKLALYLLPFRQVRRWAQSGHQMMSEQRGSADIDRIGRAVERVGKALGRLGTNCLPQALVACRLMRRKGYDVRLRIGVLKDPSDRLAAHAWVECDGRAILGNFRAGDRFTPFPDLEGART